MPHYGNDPFRYLRDRALGKIGAGLVQGVGVPTPDNNLVASVGDSRLAYGFSSSSSANSNTERLIRGVAYWLPNLTRRRVECPFDLNFAVAGANSEEVLAVVPDVIASGAGAAIVWVSTNDRVAGWGASRSIDALTEIIGTLTAAGIYVFAIAESPRGSAEFTGPRLASGQLAEHLLVHDWINTNAPAISPLVRVVDIYPDWAVEGSATGDGINEVTWDGLHPSPTGSFYVAQRLQPLIEAIYPAVSPLPIALPLEDNPLMTGASGQVDSPVTGQLANNWRVLLNGSAAAGSLTVAASKVSTGTGDWQEIEISGTTASNSGPAIYITQDVLPLTKVSDGDELESLLEWEVDAGAQNFLGPGISIIRNFSGGSETGREGRGLKAHKTWPVPALAGVSRSTAVTVDKTETSIVHRIELWLAESATVSATIRLRNTSPYKVV